MINTNKIAYLNVRNFECLDLQKSLEFESLDLGRSFEFENQDLDQDFEGLKIENFGYLDFLRSQNFISS